jgi:hypothetical protein
VQVVEQRSDVVEPEGDLGVDDLEPGNHAVAERVDGLGDGTTPAPSHRRRS